MVREPVVAGQFYQSSAPALRKEISGIMSPGVRTTGAIGAVAPHAGYLYSGRVAFKVLSSIGQKKYFILLGTNHTGEGELFGIDDNDRWSTPLGDVEIERPIARAIIKSGGGIIRSDKLSHVGEHSIEVQIPILQTLYKDFKIIPITISHANLSLYRKAGAAIATAIKELKIEDDTVIVASSDMTHREPIDDAKKKDGAAIRSILAMDEEGLLRTIDELNITMCGYAPVSVMLIAAKKLGATKAELTDYSTSAEASGDSSSVVGYAGLIIN